MGEATQNTEIAVDVDQVFTVEKFLKKMAKKAVKLGKIFSWEFSKEQIELPAKQYVPVLTWCGSESYEVRDVIRSVRMLRLHAELPKLSGWEVVGILKYEGDLPTVHAQVGKIPARFLNGRKGATSCDACGKKRHRKTIFILKKGQRTYRAIGSTCVKDFTGWDGDLNALTRWAAVLQGMFGEGSPEFEGMVSSVPSRAYDLKQFCTLAAYSIRVNGYVSWRMVEEGKAPHTTGSEVVEAMISGAGRRWKFTKSDQRLAASAIKAAKKISSKDRSSQDLLQNMWAVASGDVVEPKRAGLAAWLVEWHRREKEMAASEKRKTAKGKWCGVSSHVGRMGDRLEWTVKVVAKRVVDGYYGTTRIFEMVTETGDKLVWFCSGDTQGLEEGKIFTLKGTVKRHSEFRDEKQTAINRCKILTA